MKTTRLLRVLALLAFLLLMSPFYDSCNGHRMKQAEATDAACIDTTAVEIDSTEIDSLEISKTETDTINNSVDSCEISFLEKSYEFIDDEDSENAYEMAKLNVVYFDGPFDELIKDIQSGIKKNDYKGFFFGLKNFCFLLIVIITILISIFSFKNSNRLHKLSKLNLILLLITVICLFLDGLFATISQIKWGYYAFIIINLLIWYYSKKSVKQT